MPQAFTIRIPAANYHADRDWKYLLSEEMGIEKSSISGFQLLKKSLDARSKTIMYQLQFDVFVDEEMILPKAFAPGENDVTHSKHQAVIVGAGPAGLFAALQFIELGIQPIILERGKNVRARRRDLAAMNKQGLVNTESNYCFGEGGAGTYSDGKLYTRSNKRGDIQSVLQWFHYFGADENILIEAHPHIGTNKLPHIIENMREYIINRGGVIHFNTKLTDIILKDNSIKGVVVNEKDTIDTQHLVLATGHSARDIFELLHRKNIYIESKPFALGVRIEHPQNLIDNAQYHVQAQQQNIFTHELLRPEYLEAASYALVSKQQERSVYSFCMCPGGIIAPAATAPQEIVVNGWSPSKRNNPYANSGMVVTVDEKDFHAAGYNGPLAGMYFQQSVEQACYQSVGNGLVAPAMNVADAVQQKSSGYLPDCSYLPGVTAVDLKGVLQPYIFNNLSGALKEFDKKIKGYVTREALLVATESRTSSPVRIPREKQSLQHPQIKGLYPCAEGAGYAGGIVSAAIDGIKCADAIQQKIMNA